MLTSDAPVPRDFWCSGNVKAQKKSDGPSFGAIRYAGAGGPHQRGYHVNILCSEGSAAPGSHAQDVALRWIGRPYARIN
jgi:hypothetical protein